MIFGSLQKQTTTEIKKVPKLQQLPLMMSNRQTTTTQTSSFSFQHQSSFQKYSEKKCVGHRHTYTHTQSRSRARRLYLQQIAMWFIADTSISILTLNKHTKKSNNTKCRYTNLSANGVMAYRLLYCKNMILHKIWRDFSRLIIKYIYWVTKIWIMTENFFQEKFLNNFTEK